MYTPKKRYLLAGFLALAFFALFGCSKEYSKECGTVTSLRPTIVSYYSYKITVSDTTLKINDKYCK